MKEDILTAEQPPSSPKAEEYEYVDCEGYGYEYEGNTYLRVDDQLYEYPPDDCDEIYDNPLFRIEANGLVVPIVQFNITHTGEIGETINMTCRFCNTEKRVGVHRVSRYPWKYGCCSNKCYDIHLKDVRINPSKVKLNPPIIVDNKRDQWHLAEYEELNVGREVLFMKNPTDEQTLAIIEKVNKKSVRVKATMKRGKYPIDRMYIVTFPCVYVWDDDDDDEPTYIKGEIN